MTHRFALIAFVIAAVLFVLFPQIDLWFTGLFYDPQDGFVWQQSTALRALYKAVPVIGWATAVALCVSIVLGFVQRRGPLHAYRKGAIYLLVVLLLGPGVVVNEVIKAHSGRARPSYSEPFGGPQGVYTGLCARRPMRSQLFLCFGARRRWFFLPLLCLCVCASATYVAGRRGVAW